MLIIYTTDALKLKAMNLSAGPFDQIYFIISTATKFLWAAFTLTHYCVGFLIQSIELLIYAAFLQTVLSCATLNSFTHMKLKGTRLNII